MVSTFPFPGARPIAFTLTVVPVIPETKIFTHQVFYYNFRFTRLNTRKNVISKSRSQNDAGFVDIDTRVPLTIVVLFTHLRAQEPTVVDQSENHRMNLLT